MCLLIVVLELRIVVRIIAWFAIAIVDRLLLARLPSSFLPRAVSASVSLRVIFLVILAFFRTMFIVILVLLVLIRVCFWVLSIPMLQVTRLLLGSIKTFLDVLYYSYTLSPSL